MSTLETQWSKQELTAYILLFCSHANYHETESEIATIESIVGEETVKKMHREFDKDNDYKRIEKIRSTVDRYDYSTEDIDALFEDIKSVFMADGEYDTLEQNLYRGLKHLIAE